MLGLDFIREPFHKGASHRLHLSLVAVSNCIPKILVQAGAESLESFSRLIPSARYGTILRTI